MINSKIGYFYVLCTVKFLFYNCNVISISKSPFIVLLNLIDFTSQFPRNLNFSAYLQRNYLFNVKKLTKHLKTKSL